MMRSAASPIAAHGERKFAVLMFADLTGYTELCRRLDPEDVAATVRPVMAAMKAAVELEGGVVPSISGDGFMAVFGIPQTDERAAVRALHVANRLRAIISDSNTKQGAFRIPDVHIGIAAGEVLVVPSDEAVGWSLVGNPVNMASRLCDAAGPDDVLFDDVTRQLADMDDATARRQELSVAGVTEPVPAWLLEREVAASSHQIATVPFVNRSFILSRLESIAADCAGDGVSRVVLVAGEAGIGKTRTVRHWLDTRNERLAWTQCGDTRGGSSLAGAMLTVANVAGIIDLPSPLLNVAAEPLSPLRPDPFPAAVAASRAIATQFGSATGSIIVLDDAHKADPSLLAFLADVRERPLSAPLLVIATWRGDEVETPWQPEIVLEPLSDLDAADLLTAALGAPPPRAIADSIAARIGGHPLMAVQSAAFLIESGVVDVADGKCELRRPDAVEVLPTSLRLFVAARIDRLPTADKAALQELSTFGEDVDRRAVERLCGRHVHAAVPSLLDRGLLRESGAGWRFTHGLVQQVAYSSLPRSIRAELHRRQAEFHRGSDTVSRFRHAINWAECASTSEPEQVRAAVRTALDAAEQHARVLYATQADAAHSVVRQVASLLADHMYSFPHQAIHLYVLDARALIEMGRFEDALWATERALELLVGNDDADHLPALLARGHALSRLRRYQAARQTLDEALALADSCGDHVARGHALRLLGDSYRHTSFPDFLRLTEEAFSTLAKAGDRTGAAECACTMAYLRSVSAQFERWRATALDYVGPDDPRGQLWLARADLEAHHIRRNDRMALTAAHEAVRLGRLVGARDGLADGLTGITRSACGLGDLAAAIQAGDELRDLAVAHSNPRMRLVAAAELVVPLLRSGRLDDMLAELDYTRAVAVGVEGGDAAMLATASGIVARDRGRWQEAAALLAQPGELGEEISQLERLAVQVVEATVHSVLDPSPAPTDIDRLAAQCHEAGAPLLASLARAVAEQRRIVEGEAISLEGPLADACLEERAIRADTAALLAERDGQDAKTAWRDAADAWGRLGYTVFLARAQARSGDTSAANETLEAIGADNTARTWALHGAH